MMRALLLIALAVLPTIGGAQVAPADPAARVKAVLMAPGLRVTDIERSKRFYATALGLVPAMTLPSGKMTETMLCADSAHGNMVLILLGDTVPGKASPVTLGDGFEKVVLRVADVAARTKGAGYPVGEPHVNKLGPRR